MDDGVDLAGMLWVGKEIVGKTFPVELLSVVDFRTDQLDELPAYLFVCGGQSLGFCITVIDRNAELLTQQVGDIAFSTANATRDSNRIFAI